MKASIYFVGDTSVGILPYIYEMDVPPFEEEFREDIRMMIEDLYVELDGEFGCQVYFSDETMD